MEHHPTWVGDLFNWLFGGAVLPLLEAIGVHPHDPHRPIPDHIATMLFIFFVSGVFFLWFRRRLSVHNPGALQICFESLLTNDFRVGIYDLLDEIAGHGGRKYLAIIGTVGLFVLLCNGISLIPGFVSPTAHHTVPLGCALVVFVYYHFAGLKVHGLLGYAKHFISAALASPPYLWFIMIPLLIIVETVSHAARLLSLTVRLWVNMVVSELLYVTFLGLAVFVTLALGNISEILGALGWAAPLLIPLPFVILHAFVAFLQAFVFTLLPVVYVGEAVAHEH